jgi:hypothetical protein
VKGRFPFIFLLLQRAYAGVGRNSTSNAASRLLTAEIMPINLPCNQPQREYDPAS